MAIRTAQLDSSTVRRIAVETDSDPRTVVRALMGHPVRGMVGHRLAEYLAQHGLQPENVQIETVG